VPEERVRSVHSQAVRRRWRRRGLGERSFSFLHQNPSRGLYGICFLVMSIVPFVAPEIVPTSEDLVGSRVQ